MTGLRLRTVVVGFDGSPPSERALERGATLVGSDGSVIVVAARPSLVSQGVVSEQILDNLSADKRSEVLQRSRALLYERGIEATLVAADADPAEALIQAAQNEDAEMILVGHTGVARRPYGSGVRHARAAGPDCRERAPSRAVRRAGHAVGV